MTNTQSFTTKNAQELQFLGVQLAKKRRTGRLFLLSGPLGAGKTTFAQGYAKGLGIKKRLVSPTFSLVNIYPIPRSKHRCVHVDLYRIKSAHELRPLDIHDLLSDKNAIILIEWPEKFPSLLRHFHRTVIRFAPTKYSRVVTIRTIRPQARPR
jgi:tRNA threonylcarbamoyladenosine biosynthesis protein TsaE